MKRYGKDYKLELMILNKENSTYVDNFYCGNETIDFFFQEEAKSDSSTVTYLFIDIDSNSLVACMSISCSAIFKEVDAKNCEFSTILPSMEIKYFAVASNYQHLPYEEGSDKPTLSDFILDCMITHMIELSNREIGASKIILYSVPEASTFYRRHGFKDFGSKMYGDKGTLVSGCEPMFLDIEEE